ncbi:hypothetical protein HW532_19185 [Kaustia mangrovi]|uniref:Uncharacterized protein n=1 Tax=Kaustia mangrovi TaxID=2593653 RepID=A0A7S8HDB4_9HYPH|nr:hypothetical protein [Kaustia mangrovi]QPC44637.1 hypothetical protein HW532_19185 [Kaustia mangrovi]
MAGAVRYQDKAPRIREVLKTWAREGAPRSDKNSYAELGRLVGIPAQGPWKPVLDLISCEEEAKGLPDITYMVIRKSTGLPGQIGGSPANPPTSAQIATAREKLQEVFKRYCPTARVSF